MWITPCQRRNRVIFVPCAALTIGAQNGVCSRKFVHRLAIWTTIAETISVSVFCFVTSSDSPLIPFFPYIFIFSTKPLALSILTRLIFIFNLYQLSRRLHLLNFYYLVLFFLPLHSIPYKFLYTLDSIHLRNRLFIVLWSNLHGHMYVYKLVLNILHSNACSIKYSIVWVSVSKIYECTDHDLEVEHLSRVYCRCFAITLASIFIYTKQNTSHFLYLYTIVRFFLFRSIFVNVVVWTFPDKL